MGGMDVTFQRLGGNRYFANAARADGVTVQVPGYDRTSAIPHDLAHFVAEREFGVTRGFWGSVAAGALFTNMVVVSGRQKPHAAERSKQIIKAHADDLGISEALAGVVHDAVEEDLAVDVVLERLRGYWGIISAAPLPVVAADVEPAVNALRRAAERWAAVPVDEGLTLTWPLPVEKVPVPCAGKARTGRSRRGR
ncbi:hypothetical protein D0T12_28515 [Actinomadura spongiicola]|uniref:Uncharacterized protein n=1 Tax=Actinomadura spongiicola TaxID=2303421 RepID=A0A372G9W8_9ACTN|nr:hypothetical protein [Actinomadura spongiicola]RFS82184.1 hypothetical protein D0T12_28515 [Actinomadura spongiicola]